MFYFFLRFYLFNVREKGREGEREGEKHQCPLACPQLGTWSATQACVLTGNRTSEPLVHRPALNPLSHTSQQQPIMFQILLTIHVVKGIRVTDFSRFNISDPFNFPQKTTAYVLTICFALSCNSEKSSTHIFKI